MGNINPHDVPSLENAVELYRNRNRPDGVESKAKKRFKLDENTAVAAYTKGEARSQFKKLLGRKLTPHDVVEEF